MCVPAPLVCGATRLAGLPRRNKWRIRGAGRHCLSFSSRRSARWAEVAGNGDTGVRGLRWSRSSGYLLRKRWNTGLLMRNCLSSGLGCNRRCNRRRPDRDFPPSRLPQPIIRAFPRRRCPDPATMDEGEHLQEPQGMAHHSPLTRDDAKRTLLHTCQRLPVARANRKSTDDIFICRLGAVRGSNADNLVRDPPSRAG
jgi:hypothetical protein